MKRNFFWSMAAATLMFVSAVANAESPTEMLQAGIYQEETAGNLDEALRIYRKIIDDAEKVQNVAAQAQFRVGQCLLKQGKKTEASQAFESLIKQFPDERDLVAKSRSYLPGAAILLPAPWKSGERLTLELKLPAGQTIGIIGLGIDEDRVGENDVWRMYIRRFVLGGQNQGTSVITVDRQQNKPLRTEWDHTILGAVTADFEAEKLVMATKSKTEKEPSKKSVDLKGPRYSNDQVFYMLRQLPLEVGYKTTLPVIVEFAGGNQLDIGAEVPVKEKIDTVAGSFDCFKVELNIGQTFWISDTPERYVVKFEAEGMAGLLSSIHSSERQNISSSNLGVSLEAPGSWHTLELSAEDDAVGRGIFLVPPQMVSAQVKVRERSSLNPTENESAKAWAESRLKERGKVAKNVKLREGGMTPNKLAGADAISMVYDASLFGRSVVGSDTVSLTENSAVLFGTTSAADIFDSVRADLDKVRESITVK